MRQPNCGRITRSPGAVQQHDRMDARCRRRRRDMAIEPDWSTRMREDDASPDEVGVDVGHSVAYSRSPVSVDLHQRALDLGMASLSSLARTRRSSARMTAAGLRLEACVLALMLDVAPLSSTLVVASMRDVAALDVDVAARAVEQRPRPASLLSSMGLLSDAHQLDLVLAEVELGRAVGEHARLKCCSAGCVALLEASACGRCRVLMHPRVTLPWSTMPADVVGGLARPRPTGRRARTAGAGRRARTPTSTSSLTSGRITKPRSAPAPSTSHARPRALDPGRRRVGNFTLTRPRLVGVVVVGDDADGEPARRRRATSALRRPEQVDERRCSRTRRP